MQNEERAESDTEDDDDDVEKGMPEDTVDRVYDTSERDSPFESQYGPAQKRTQSKFTPTAKSHWMRKWKTKYGDLVGI